MSECCGCPLPGSLLPTLASPKCVLTLYSLPGQPCPLQWLHQVYTLMISKLLSQLSFRSSRPIFPTLCGLSPTPCSIGGTALICPKLNLLLPFASLKCVPSPPLIFFERTETTQKLKKPSRIFYPPHLVTNIPVSPRNIMHMFPSLSLILLPSRGPVRWSQPSQPL